METTSALSSILRTSPASTLPGPNSKYFAAPGFCSELLTLYLAEGLERARTDRLAHDQDEELEVSFAPLAEVLRDAQDAKTLIAAALLSARGRPGS